MNKRITMFLPILVIVAMLASMFGMALPVAGQGPSFHGIGVVKAQTGPWPDPDIARAGDTVTVEIMVSNLDTTIPSHAIRIDSIIDVVQHASGNVSSGNLLSSPVTLPTLGSFITVNYTYVVENGDNNPLIDTASADGVDLGTGLAVTGTTMYQLTIIAPDIDIEKYVSVDGGVTWLDADSAPGPSAVVGNNVKFKVTVCNNGSANLTNILVNDSDFTFTGVATSLIAGACDDSDILTVAAVLGQQYDLATVTGTIPEGPSVTDNDPAYYTGVIAGIDIEKYVSVDGGVTWLDADSAPGPSAVVGNNVKFYVTVCNNGTTNLTNIVVGDTDFTFTGVATSLLAGACDDSDILTVAAVLGQQYDLATVTGNATGVPVTDNDPAYYTGLIAGIDIEKYVSVDGGVTWLDADSAPGPSAVVGNNVKFKVTVCNNGTANLTNIVVGDTDFTFIGVATSLLAGACDDSDILTVAAVAGQQYDLATVTGNATGVPVTDNDPAYYTGIIAGIDIEKYVSVDGGLTWLDADTAPGPSAEVGKNVSFYVTVCNNGTAPVTNILVNDTDFTFTDIATSLAAGVCDNSSIVTVAAVAGQQYDLATVTGNATGVPVTDSDPANYLGVAVRISITPLTDDNEVGTNHTLTIKLEKSVEAGVWTALAGQTVTASLSNSDGATAAFVGSNSGATNASGQFDVIINSPTPGSTTVWADWAGGTVEGASISAKTTDPDADKDWVAVRISITPLTGTNPVGTNHTLTIKLEKSVEAGVWTALAGQTVTASLSNSGGATAAFVGSNSGATNASGQFDVIINSPTPGSTTVWADWAGGTVEGATITAKTTDPDANKDWTGGGGEGCTPGYWKNNAKNWNHSAWVGYLPGDSFETVFSVNVTLNANGKATYPTPTLLEALDANGGGINALARHAVAALLNIANPDIAYGIGSTAALITMVHDAIVSGDEAQIDALHVLLAGYNEAGCPLNQRGEPIMDGIVI